MKITNTPGNNLFIRLIFLDTLETGSTRFIQLELEGTAAGLDLQLSGLVDGKPLAALPARALLMDDD